MRDPRAPGARPGHPAGESVADRRKTTFVGMLMALASWTMLFASLFFAYAVLRLKAPTWPPDGAAALPKLLPAFNTLLMILSSFVLHQGVKAGTAERLRLLRSLFGTIALGTIFLLLQLAVWIPLWRSGFRIDSGIYGSIFYGLTVFHALHVLAGLIALFVVALQARRGLVTSGRRNAVRMTAMFWHFVDVVWVLLFAVVYLV
ncbi:MAG: heme-copper oxidase subunit III [Thermoanaerobaculia bacterium]